MILQNPFVTKPLNITKIKFMSGCNDMYKLYFILCYFSFFIYVWLCIWNVLMLIDDVELHRNGVTHFLSLVISK